MDSKMNFNNTELAELSEEILAHVPDNRKESLLAELHKLDKEIDNCRKRLREMQKNEIIGKILPVIFHKMKNKLTPILGYSQILLTKIGDEKLREKVKKIERNTDELAHQFNVLRDYFFIGKTEKRKENLNKILSALKSHFSVIGKNQKVSIELDLDSTIPEDDLAAGQIETLIINIVDNAVLAIKAKNTAEGIIKIKTQSETDVYTLSLKDNGIGMRREDIAKIWTPFFSKFPDRAGIGLTICEKIISDHDATFMVDSVEGEFSEFVIIFKRKSGAIQEDKIEDIQKTHRGGINK